MSSTTATTTVRVLRAYKNDPELRTRIIQEMEWHVEQDKIVRMTYGEECENGDFRGCFMGCAIHSLARINGIKLKTSRHQLGEDYLEIPVEIFHLADAVFESLSVEKGKEFALKFFPAIRTGADLSMVIPNFLYWTLTDDVKPTRYPKFQGFIDAVVALYEEWTRTGVKPPLTAYRADLAYRAYRADLAYLADRAEKSAAKLLELLEQAPILSKSA